MHFRTNNGVEWKEASKPSLHNRSVEAYTYECGDKIMMEQESIQSIRSFIKSRPNKYQTWNGSSFLVFLLNKSDICYEDWYWTKIEHGTSCILVWIRFI